jgi:hypothetical protein
MFQIDLKRRLIARRISLASQDFFKNFLQNIGTLTTIKEFSAKALILPVKEKL